MDKLAMENGISFAYPHEWNGVMHHGATLRECFAAAAMQGAIATDKYGDYEPADLARYAIECADALLVELAKPATAGEDDNHE